MLQSDITLHVALDFFLVLCHERMTFGISCKESRNMAIAYGAAANVTGIFSFALPLGLQGMAGGYAAKAHCLGWKMPANDMDTLKHMGWGWVGGLAVSILAP